MTNDEIWLYKRSGGGTTVIPNPEGTATDDLEKVQIGDDIYAIPQPDLTNYLTSSDVGAAALSNSYNDLDNKPTIPTVPTTVSSFTNDAGYLVQSDLSGYVESSDLATVATSGLYSDLSGTPTIPAAVEANPQETGTADLEKIKIGATVYDIPSNEGIAFSENEFDTGMTWIDGKKIYGKVVTFSGSVYSGVNIRGETLIAAFGRAAIDNLVPRSYQPTCYISDGYLYDNNDVTFSRTYTVWYTKLS